MAASLAGVSPVATTVLTPFQLDALCLGGFFAVYLRQPGGEAAVRRAILPMALVAAGAARAAISASTASPTSACRCCGPCAAGCSGCCSPPCSCRPCSRRASSLAGALLPQPPHDALGKYSYGLYVYHHFLSYYFITHGTEFALARAVGSHTLAVALQAAGGMAVSLAVAWLSYELFEKHFLRAEALLAFVGRGPEELTGQRLAPADGSGAERTTCPKGGRDPRCACD